MSSFAIGGLFAGVPCPIRLALALAAGFLLIAVKVAVSVAPAAEGEYSTVTEQDLFFPRLVVEQPLTRLRERRPRPSR